MIESKYSCDGCGAKIQTESHYDDYSHFDLVPVRSTHGNSNFIYSVYFPRQDTLQFCSKCKSMMMAVLPIKRYVCGVCVHTIVGEPGQTVECIETKHMKEQHPGYTMVTYGSMGLESERTFTEDQSVKMDHTVFPGKDDHINFSGESPIEDKPPICDFCGHPHKPGYVCNIDLTSGYCRCIGVGSTSVSKE